jgi:hypothetical protein
LRHGRAAEALDAYGAHERVLIASSSNETRASLVAHWWAEWAEGCPAVMIAARRSNVADLNRRARSLMLAAGMLGEESLEFGGLSFATGDRVMTLKNSRRLGVINGSRGTIHRLDAAKAEVTLEMEDGSLVTLPRSYVEEGYLTHAYAITGHKAQGMTTERAFVLGDETLYREWAYVAMSRGKLANRMYVVVGTDLEREEVGGEVAPVADPMGEVTRALTRSRAKELALDAYEAEVRDGSREGSPGPLQRSYASPSDRDRQGARDSIARTIESAPPGVGEAETLERCLER